MPVYVHTRPVVACVPPSSKEYFDGQHHIPLLPQVMTSETPDANCQSQMGTQLGGERYIEC